MCHTRLLSICKGVISHVLEVETFFLLPLWSFPLEVTADIKAVGTVDEDLRGPQRTCFSSSAAP